MRALLPRSVALLALAMVCRTPVGAQTITAFDIKGQYQLLVPQAPTLTYPNERDIRFKDVAAVIWDPLTCTWPGIRSRGDWREAGGALTATGTPESACPPLPTSNGVFTSYTVRVGAEGVGNQYELQPALFLDTPPGSDTFGNDHYYFDRDDTDVLAVPPTPPMPPCEPEVHCLDGQTFCECAGILTIEFRYGVGCVNRGDPIPIGSADYPRSGRITVQKRNPDPCLVWHPQAQATSDVKNDRPTRLLVQDYDDVYDVTIDVKVGTDRYSDTFRYVFEEELPGLDCAVGATIPVELPCNGVNPTCCQENPTSPCCLGTGNTGPCCPGLDCCALNPGDVCCNGASTGGVCCNQGLHSQWQSIPYESQVVYHDAQEQKLPVVRVDRGEFDNERLAQVLQPLQTTACGNDLAHFDVRRIFQSPPRPDPGPPPPGHTGDYRISSFHLTHDSSDPALDGQPCGPLPGQAPCGQVQLIWSSSGAGERAANGIFTNGEMLWDACADTTVGDAYVTPDSQFDWLYLPGGVLPAELRRCDGVPAGSGCVTTYGQPPTCVDDLFPFVMRPGRIHGTVSLWDGPTLELADHLRIRTWAVEGDGGSSIISGSESWVHADGVKDDDTTPCNAVADDHGQFLADEVPARIPWWWNRFGEQGMVQSNLLDTTATAACLGDGMRRFSYQLNPAQMGNMSGWYQPHLRLRFFDETLPPQPLDWPLYLDGAIELHPNDGGSAVRHHVEPQGDVPKDYCECLGKIEFFITSTNADISTGTRTEERPNVIGRLVHEVTPCPSPPCYEDGPLMVLGNESDVIFLGGGTGFNGEVCPVNDRVALVNLAVPAGTYRLFPSVLYAGAAGRTEFDRIYSCEVECGATCRMCLEDFRCDNAQVLYPPGAPPIPLGADCTAPVTAAFHVFDCDSEAEVDVIACTDDPRVPGRDATLDATCRDAFPGTCVLGVKQERRPVANPTDPCTPTNVTIDLRVGGDAASCPGTTDFCFIVSDLEVPAHTATTCAVSVEFADVTPPTIACPGNVTLDCSDPAPVPGGATAADNCGTPTIGHADAWSVATCPLVLTRTYTATDGCGNTSSCQQVVTFTDTTPPVINCPPDTTLDCAATLPPAMPSPCTATDDCHDVTITFLGESSTGYCPRIVTRTYRATDECGNTADGQVRFVLRDTTPPVITCPPDVTQECDVPLPPALPSPCTATDDCNTVTITLESETTTGTCPEVVTRTYRATDLCGNTAEAQVRTTLVDTTPPVIDCPPDTTLDCSATLPDPVPPPCTAQDACHAATVAYVGETRTGTCPEVVTRTYRATDACGNSTSGQVRFTLVDTTPPDITCPPDTTQDCAVPLPPPLPIPCTATDDCNAVTLAYVGETRAGDCPEIVTRTYRATDACGNTKDGQVRFFLTDTTPPRICSPAPSGGCPGPTEACVVPVIDECLLGNSGAYVCFDLPVLACDDCHDPATLTLSCSCQCISKKTGLPSGPCDAATSCFYDTATSTWCVQELKCNVQGDPSDKIYTLTATARDVCGNASTAVIGRVTVYHDNRDPKCNKGNYNRPEPGGGTP
jgi:hypothetical protein